MMLLDTEQTKTMEKYSASVPFTIYFYFLHFNIILAQYLNQSSARGQRFLTFVVIVQYRAEQKRANIQLNRLHRARFDSALLSTVSLSIKGAIY